MIEIGSVLVFVPHIFSSGQENLERKKRYMVVIGVDTSENTVKMLNLTSAIGKSHYSTYSRNVLIRNFNPPLPKLSYVKLNDVYIVEKFSELSNYLLMNGAKLAKEEIDKITTKYEEYIQNHDAEIAYITKEEFIKHN